MCVAEQLPKSEVTRSDFNVSEVTYLGWASVIDFLPSLMTNGAVIWTYKKGKTLLWIPYKDSYFTCVMLWFFTSYLCKWRPEYNTRFLSHRHNVVYIQCWKVENIEQKYVFGILNPKLFWKMVPGVLWSRVSPALRGWSLGAFHVTFVHV